MNNEAYLFFMFIINGILIGFLFDIFRILRKSFQTSDIITYVEDVLFWILTGILTLYFIFYFNNGEIRLYIFLGILLGILLYMITISSYIIKFFVYVINTIKKVIMKIEKIITYPLRLLFRITKKILFRPFSFIFINIRKSFIELKGNISKLIKKCIKPQKNHV